MLLFLCATPEKIHTTKITILAPNAFHDKTYTIHIKTYQMTTKLENMQTVKVQTEGKLVDIKSTYQTPKLKPLLVLKQCKLSLKK